MKIQYKLQKMDIKTFTKVGIGQDSHRFSEDGSKKRCVIGGVMFDETPSWEADSDGDIVYHAICNAITSITHVPILGGIAIEMCRSGITDSSQYLMRAKESLNGLKIVHVALSIEIKRPRIQAKINEMRSNVANILEIAVDMVGITCTSGDGLTDFGKGIGGQCFCIITIDIIDLFRN